MILFFINIECTRSCMREACNCFFRSKTSRASRQGWEMQTQLNDMKKMKQERNRQYLMLYQ